MGAGTPGRRGDTLHEHALMRRAAHTDFPRKDRAAKLEFETFFGHENHVTRSFYRFMLCNKRQSL